MKKLAPILLAITLLMGNSAWGGGLVIVVNVSETIEHLSRDDVINIFLGRYRKWPNGTTARPIDLVPEKARFYSLLVGKSLPEMNAYWARLIFSGSTAPPLTVENTDELLKLIHSSSGAIGYIDRDKVDSRSKIVFQLEP